MADAKAESVGGGCAALVITAVVMFFILRSCSQQEQRSQEERDKAAVALEANDKREAKARGMTFEDYREARWASNTAYAECKVAAEGRAKRDYKADLLPNSDWDVKGKTITIVGKDLRMQNGFGVYERVTYHCEWDMQSRHISKLDVLEN